jgi:hypothetical protein
MVNSIKSLEFSRDRGGDKWGEQRMVGFQVGGVEPVQLGGLPCIDLERVQVRWDQCKLVLVKGSVPRGKEPRRGFFVPAGGLVGPVFEVEVSPKERESDRGE